MLIYCDLKPINLYDSIHELIRMGYPDCSITLEPAADADVNISVSMEEKGESIEFKGTVMEEKETGYSEVFMLKGSELHNGINKAARIFIFKLLTKHLKREVNAYGILTGVRPVKLVHRLIDKGYDSVSIIEILEKEYLLKRDKAELLNEVACNSRPYLLNRDEATGLVSIYIGIPYCPSRCYYCSFPGAVVKNYAQEIPAFLNALYQEMQAIGDYLKANNIKVQTVYIGGGTPTVLSEEDTTYLFSLLHEKFVSEATTEITVEAGRPDTLSPSKLKILQQAGVNRVCINPQTMNDITLKRIGRNHDAKGVMQSVEWVRSAGIKNINMDLIVGLPGENIQENMYTAEQILGLEPENITVHTLAVKRGSLMADSESRTNPIDRVIQVEQGVKYFSDVFREAGYVPYYLYRQKYMKGNMENTGFSRHNSFCLYNIQMIEERQTIIGMGGGAASKFVNPSDWTLSSFYNPKNPKAYCESIERLINRKVDKLRGLN